MRIFLIFSLLFIFFSCSDDQISQINFPNKTFIEFDWCIYKSNYVADDLVEIFIDYKNILQNDISILLFLCFKASIFLLEKS
jgi:hypothetical protein